MAWPKAMPIAEVLWVDSQSLKGWQDSPGWQADLAGEAVMWCRSVGWLYARTRQHVVLMQSQSSGGQLADAIQIPRCAILQVRIIERGQRMRMCRSKEAHDAKGQVDGPRRESRQNQEPE